MFSESPSDGIEEGLIVDGLAEIGAGARALGDLARLVGIVGGGEDDG
jgi:hypothetical protein